MGVQLFPSYASIQKPLYTFTYGMQIAIKTAGIALLTFSACWFFISVGSKLAVSLPIASFVIPIFWPFTPFLLLKPILPLLFKISNLIFSVGLVSAIVGASGSAYRVIISSNRELDRMYQFFSRTDDQGFEQLCQKLHVSYPMNIQSSSAYQIALALERDLRREYFAPYRLGYREYDSEPVNAVVGHLAYASLEIQEGSPHTIIHQAANQYLTSKNLGSYTNEPIDIVLLFQLLVENIYQYRTT